MGMRPNQEYLDNIAKKKTVETRANPKAIGMPVARTTKVATMIQTDSIKGDI